MQENLKRLFQQVLEKGTNEELEVLKHILEGLNHQDRTFINRLLHMENKKTNEGIEVKIPLNAMVNNPLNILHGGITATVIDSAMGILAHQSLPDGKAAVTTQLSIHYIAQGIGDFITCQAKIEHFGSKTLLASADVFRSDGQKIAQATGSFFIIEKRQNKK
ncbi:hypothetical protein J27TS8_13910 [Robertmurraya siralis]|uniref:Acyl-coenzyme A thioesterase THEM4 n=1 Tax=Robertmurraya siralis TaxID=77777 RepID=A0A920BSX7_9BACI|nr:PaaI family thioesterase [Robertmurraya siralis]GIN61398.1 hypothetical protein J27TS8_13910 [Robertmurraya siralis]